MIRLICISALSVILVLAGAVLFGSSRTEAEGFAIYLTREDVPPENMKMLICVDIADQPIISIEDIITYDALTHEIALIDQAFERIAQLEVPVTGRSFLVCVDRRPIYWGAFWAMHSSLSFDRVTIWTPPMAIDSRTIKLELGYPCSSWFYGGEDPRNTAQVMESLDQAGKLINRLLPLGIAKLPRSFKGYELYSWQEDDQWHFTLITGTNRTKTMEEITSGENLISDTGWVRIHVVGEETIKAVLSRLYGGESVYWCDELHIEGATEPDLELPPEDAANSIKEHAEQCGLDFAITVQSY